MGPGDSLRLAVFVGAAFAVFGCAVWILVRRVVRRLRGRPDPSSRAARVAGHVVLLLAALGIGCVVWGFFVEPFRLTVTRIRIASARLARGSRPIRVVHVTDLHCDPEPRLEERLPEAIAAEKPDLVVFTGDAVNSPEGLPVFRRCLSRIAAIAPTLAVKGNWDAWYWPELDRFGGTGARELDANAVRVSVAGTDVWVAGVAADEESRGREALREVPPGALTLFLFHYPYPEVVAKEDRGRVDLLLAGHVHGGQVALPGYGAILTLSRHGKRYEHGLYELGPMRMFVSRGIGMEGGSAPRVRFCAPPEIVVIEIVPQE